MNGGGQRGFTDIALDLLKDIFCVITYPQGMLIRWNDSFRQATGYSDEELPRMTLSDLLDEKGKGRLEDLMDELVDAGETTTEANLFNESGDELPFELHMTLARDPANGAPMAIVITGRDAHGKDVMTSVLEESGKKWQQSFDSIDEGMIIIDPQFNIVEFNKAFLEIVGKTADEVESKKCYQLVHGTEGQPDFCVVQDSLLHKQQVRSEIFEPYINKHLDVSAHPVLDENGELDFAVHVFRDISAKKETEKEGERLIVDLGERIKELDCLYSFAEIIEKPGITQREILQETVDILPAAWRYPDVACSMLIYNEDSFATENCRETDWSLTSDIKVRGSSEGSIIVNYLEERPFLPEEQRLLDTIAERLGRVIERLEAEEAIEASEEKFREIFEESPIGIELYDREGSLVDANPACLEIFGVSTLSEIKGFKLFEDPNLDNEVVGRLDMGETVRYESTFDFEKVKRLDLYETRKSGQVELSVSITPITRTPGVIDGYLAQVQDITARKRVEQALLESQAKTLAVLESSPDFIQTVDREGSIIYSNRPMLGMTPEELAGRNASELIPQESRSLLQRAIRRTFQTGAVNEIEFRGPENTWWRSQFAPLRKEGAVTEVMIVSTDFTERRRAEKLARAQRDLALELAKSTSLEETMKNSLHTILEILEVDCGGLYLLEGNSLKLFHSEGFSGDFTEEISILSPGDRGFDLAMSGDPVFEEYRKLGFPESDARASEGLRIAGIIPIKYKEDIIGSLNIASHYRGELPEESKFVAESLVEQVSQALIRSWLSDALEKSESQYRDLYENAPSSFFSVGTDGLIKRCNRQARALLGYEPGELVGRHVFDLYSDTPEGRERAEEVFERFKAGETILNQELQMQRSDGESIWVNLSVRPHKDETGTVVESRSIVTDITEIKEARSALAASEERYRELAESLPQVVFETDQSGKITYINNTAFDLFGYTEEEFERGIHALDVIERADQQRVAGAIEKMMDGRSRGAVREYLARKKNGTTFPVVVYSNLIEDEEGNPAGIRGILTDITERKEAEQALRESEERYRDLFENASDLIQSVTPEGRFLYVNRAWRETLGYSEHELADMTLMDVIHPESLEHCMEIFQRVMEGEEAKDIEAVFKSKSGRKVFVRGSANCRFEDGAPISTRGIFRDITLRKIAEEKLKESEERYRFLAQNATDVIWTTDMDLNWTYLSPSHERQTGFTVKEGLAMPLKDTVTPESLDSAMSLLAQVIEDERAGRNDPDRTWTLEVEQYCKGGSTIWVELKMKFVRDQEGDPTGIQGVARDVSERKMMEDELQKINKELSGFAHTVSHDLKSPLSAIGMSAETLRYLLEQPQTDEIKKEVYELLDAVERKIYHSSDLIEDLLQLAEAGQVPEEVTPVDVGETVQSVLNDRLGTLKQDIRVKVDDDLGEVRANPTHIYQVFANLIGNAVKHNDNKEPQIEVNLLNEQDGVHTYLVRDNGSGINPEYLPNVFDPFFKGAETGETGIGLSTVEKIVRLYGGSIRAYNDGGACFEFSIKDYA